MSDSDHDTVPEFIPPDDETAEDSGDRRARHRWVLPTVLIGCGCIGLPLLLVVFGALGISNTLLRLYRSTGSYQVYQLAAETIETDEAVLAALGDPITTGWTSRVRETYETSESGQVCMRFSVTGSDRSGSAYVEATSLEGSWQLHQLIVSVNGETPPIAVEPLTTEERPLCPDFDDPDTFEDSDPDAEEEILPDTGTEI